MQKLESFEKISPTAKLVAYMRSFTNIPYAKEIAEESGITLGLEHKEILLRFVHILEARYKTTNLLLLRYPTDQILEIAAGLSPRCLVMSLDPSVTYVVSDLPQMLELQRTTIRKILEKTRKSSRSSLHFSPANALDPASLSRAALEFKTEKPLTVISEGLLLHLTHEEKMILASNVRELLKTFNGARWILSDAYTRKAWQEISRIDDNQQQLNAISKMSERDIESNCFEDDKAIAKFFVGAGLRVKDRIYYSQVSKDLSSLNLANPKDEGSLRRKLDALESFALIPK